MTDPEGFGVSSWRLGLRESIYPSWLEDEFGTLSLTVHVGDEAIRLATVACDADTGLYKTYIGHRFSSNRLGRHNSSQERAVRKAEDFLIQKLRKLL